MHVVMKQEKPTVNSRELERGKMYKRVSPGHPGLLLCCCFESGRGICLVDLTHDRTMLVADLPRNARFVEVEGYYVTSVAAQIQQRD